MRLENIVSVKIRKVLAQFFSSRNLKLTQSNLDNLRGTDIACELDHILKRLGIKPIFPPNSTSRLFKGV